MSMTETELQLKPTKVNIMPTPVRKSSVSQHSTPIRTLTCILYAVVFLSLVFLFNKNPTHLHIPRAVCPVPGSTTLLSTCRNRLHGLNDNGTLKQDDFYTTVRHIEEQLNRTQRLFSQAEHYKLSRDHKRANYTTMVTQMLDMGQSLDLTEELLDITAVSVHNASEQMKEEQCVHI